MATGAVIQQPQYKGLIARIPCDILRKVMTGRAEGPGGMGMRGAQVRWQGLPRAVQLLGIGWYFAACIVVGIVGGVVLDSVLGLSPLFTLLGLLLGLATAGYGGYRMLMVYLGNQGPPRGRGNKG